MFKPDDFLSHFAKHNDFAKVSKFQVLISKPPGLSTVANLSELRLQCEAAELPGYNINTVDAKIYGPPTPVASTSAFGDINLTFICAGDLWEKRLFDSWMDLIVPKNNYQLNFKDEYVAKVDITQFYETGEPSLVISLWNAFPIAVAPLSLNWGDDSIHKLGVTFKYDYWSSNNATPARAPEAARSTARDRSTQPSAAASDTFRPGDPKQSTGIPSTLGSLGPGYQPGDPRGIIPGGATGVAGPGGNFGTRI